MAKVDAKKEKKNVKKGKNSVNKDGANIRVYEKYTCVVVGVIIALLLFAVIKNPIFIPAFLITVGLELFCVAYYYMEDKNKQSLVYGLFIGGVLLVVIALIYTIVNTI